MNMTRFGQGMFFGRDLKISQHFPNGRFARETGANVISCEIFDVRCSHHRQLDGRSCDGKLFRILRRARRLFKASAHSGREAICRWRSHL